MSNSEVTVEDLYEGIGLGPPPPNYNFDMSAMDQSQSQDFDNEMSPSDDTVPTLTLTPAPTEIVINGTDLQDGQMVEININAPIDRIEENPREVNEGAIQIGDPAGTNDNGLLLDEDSNVFCGDVVKKRKSKANPDGWKRNKTKNDRMHGKEYMGYQNKSIENNDESIIKVVQDKTRPAKTLGPRCNSKFCKSSKYRQCQAISEENRNELFNQYWEYMTWGQRKVYVANTIEKTKVKVKTKGPASSKRKESLSYYLRVNNEKLQVCKFMFMSTLKVTPRQVQVWINENKTGIPNSSKSPRYKDNQKVVNHQEKIEFLKGFLDKLPKMPSHYARKNTSKLFLEPVFNSIADLYALYKIKCSEEKKSVLSRWKFDDIMKELNISLFQPKKDQCDICCGYTAGNITEVDWNAHIVKKDRARNEKNQDKKEANERKCYTLTMDLESVKVAPFLQASALYYKTKLCVHNFTVYNISNNQSTCYWWDESEGDLVASTFASCLVDYLTEYCKDNLPIVIYSDGCTYQNRNSIISNAILSYSMNTKRTVVQKYLEKGHTQMECDSVHSAIERKLKNRSIYLPSDYYKICQEARTKPFPYEVKPLTFEFFRDYSKAEHTRYKSIRPGKKVGDKTVTDMRAIKYTPDGIIFYKLEFDDEWTEIPIRPKQVSTAIFPSLYNSRLTIKERKYQDLQELKKVLPSDCHSFYNNLPH